MSRMIGVSRRGFLQGGAALAILHPLAAHALAESTLAEPKSSGARPRILKTLKIGMVEVPGSLVDKFWAVKSVGFDGIEMNAPGMDVKETKDAIAQSGLPVDGTVCASHWDVRHTSPDAAVRAQALDHLKTAIRDTHAVGGNTVLLVVGHGKDGPEKEIWPRSLENIAQAIPLAAELGIYIAIENVWNQFLYAHDGPVTQTAEKFVRYVDELNSPWVGMQFDIGNHWKYGDMAQWIRDLGKRVVKLDIKGFSRKEDKFTKIADGDIDWADVRKALAEINFTGWAAAEVSGGGVEQLREVSAHMDQVLGLN